MNQRIVYESPRRRKQLSALVVTPAIALLIVVAAVGEWACAPRARAAANPASNVAASFLSAAQAAPAPAAPTQPAPEASPSTLAQLDSRLAATVAPAMDESAMRERERRAAETAAAAAFPVKQRLELSSTMYCLKGSMRTGVRTRDGMAAGDPSVLPLGSVVRVSRPSGELIGIFVIMDTGGAIRGNKIDLYVDSCREAERWGRHPVVAEVLAIGMQR